MRLGTRCQLVTDLSSELLVLWDYFYVQFLGLHPTPSVLPLVACLCLYLLEC